MSESKPGAPTQTHSLPSGAILEEYAEGFFCLKRTKHTVVDSVYFTPEDREALLDALSE